MGGLAFGRTTVVSKLKSQEKVKRMKPFPLSAPMLIPLTRTCLQSEWIP